MKYHLYHCNLLIAGVEEKDADFPTFFGHYELAPDIDTHIQAYVDYSVRVWPLIEMDRCGEIDLSEEKAFTDLIESDDWYLMSIGSSERIRILVPIFCTAGGFNWRLNT